jgi:hypothetical protein
MSEQRGEIDQAGRLVDGGRLHRGNLVLAKNLAHNIETARQRRITKGLVRPIGSVPADSGNKRLFWVYQRALGLCQSSR